MSSKKPADLMPTKKSGEMTLFKPCTTISTEKPGEMTLFKPCTTISTSKPADSLPTNQQGEMVLIKPCETTSKRKQADTSLVIKPCDTITDTSVKKMRVMASVVENDDEDDDDDDEEGMQPNSTITSHEFEQGKIIDVKALLSAQARNFLVTAKGGEIVPIASLEGNYVVVCCFRIPFQKDSPEAYACRNLEALYSQLSLEGIDHDVKLVAVAMIDTGFDEADFNSFYSSLSLDCLAIPFSDSTSRDKICESLHLCPKSISRRVPCLVVHPNGMILQFDPYFLSDYGAESYPFTKEHFDNIDHQDEIIGQRLRSTDSPIFITEILQCDHLSLIVDENSSIPTSDLDDTVVALYLYFDGDFMVKLKDVHQKCLGEGRKFEIVLVPIPFESHHDPATFYHLMKQSALKNSGSSWLVFPFNDKICRTLWRLFHCYSEDQLIILPHGDRPGDLWGKHIATSYKVDAFPFTRDVIVERKISEIRSITLEQLLGDSHVMSDLRNKNVLLYLDYPSFGNGDRSSLFKRLKKDYRGIKASYPDAEVVFVPLGPVSGQKDCQVVSEMKWHILPFNLSKFVMNHIFNKRFVCPSLVSIGKDGKILSLSAEFNLHVSDSFASLFDNTLASEIISDLEDDTQ